MSELNQTPVTFHSSTTLQPPTAAGGTLPALNDDGLDVCMWRYLNPVDQALRMERYDRAWWAHHRLAKLAKATQSQRTREVTQ